MAKFKMLTYLQDTWLILGITLFLLVLLEIIFSIAFLVRDHVTVSDSRILDAQSQREEDRDTPWRNEYAKEMEENSLRWEPYIYWRRKPYEGKYININSDGIRLTTPSQTSPDQAGRSLRVFMFGGSTMWGTSARDACTIPSFLSKALKGRGKRIEIINFGETGYVSTQEVITLLLQLRKGNVPDIVIFYDGENDTYSAYQNEIAEQGHDLPLLIRIGVIALLQIERAVEALSGNFKRDRCAVADDGVADIYAGVQAQRILAGRAAIPAHFVIHEAIEKPCLARAEHLDHARERRRNPRRIGDGEPHRVRAGLIVNF